VRVWWPGAAPDQLFSHPSGADSTLGEGAYEVVLDERPLGGWWLVAVVDQEGFLLSEPMVVETTGSGCEDETGRQVVRVDFHRAEGTTGNPGAYLAALEAAPPQPRVASLPVPGWDGAQRTMRVPILMYHYIDVPPEDSDIFRRDLTVAPDIFRAHLITLRERGYTSITLTQLREALVTGAPLPDRPVVLTFDDGHRDNYVNAFPILLQEGFTGTFFIITDLVEARHPDYVTWEQLQEMQAAGMEIGSHTRTHPNLPGHNVESLWNELAGARAILEQRLGEEIRTFAYPAGAFDDGVIHLAYEAGYHAAVVTRQGVTHTTGNLLTLRRVRVRGSMFPPELMDIVDYWMTQTGPEP
jgi:peptidoglycan/xylan/chitin deacetylase (PgdA/CDA1 family)